MKNAYEIRGDATAVYVKRRDGTLQEFLIDTVDIPAVSRLASSFMIAKCSGKEYVKFYRKAGTNSYEKPYLHRELMDCPAGMVVDHINGNTLDNRRENLRIVTQSENLQNRSGAMSNSESGIRGVFRRKDCARWEAQVVVRRKKYRALFSTKEEAEAAVADMRKRLMACSKEGATAC